MQSLTRRVAAALLPSTKAPSTAGKPDGKSEVAGHAVKQGDAALARSSALAQPPELPRGATKVASREVSRATATAPEGASARAIGKFKAALELGPSSDAAAGRSRQERLESAARGLVVLEVHARPGDQSKKDISPFIRELSTVAGQDPVRLSNIKEALTSVARTLEESGKPEGAAFARRLADGVAQVAQVARDAQVAELAGYLKSGLTGQHDKTIAMLARDTLRSTGPGSSTDRLQLLLAAGERILTGADEREKRSELGHENHDLGRKLSELHKVQEQRYEPRRELADRKEKFEQWLKAPTELLSKSDSLSPAALVREFQASGLADMREVNLYGPVEAVARRVVADLRENIREMGADIAEIDVQLSALDAERANLNVAIKDVEKAREALTSKIGESWSRTRDMQQTGAEKLGVLGTAFRSAIEQEVGTSADLAGKINAWTAEMGGRFDLPDR